MKIITCLLIVAIFGQGALAVTQTSQNKMQIQKVDYLLEKTHLGRALKKMVALANRLQYTYDDAIEAFEAIKENLLEQKQDATDLYEQQTISHNIAVQQFEAQLIQLDIDIADDIDRIETDLAQISLLQSELQVAQQQHDADVILLQEAIDDLNDLESFYAYELSQYNEADEVLEDAIEQLKSAQTHYAGAQFSDETFFVQIKNKFVSFSQKIQTVSSKFSATHQLQIQPVVLMLTQLGTSESSVDVALQALEQLQAYFQQALSDLTAAYILEKAYLQGVIGELTEIITILENEIIPGLQQDIDEVTADWSIAVDKLAADIAAKEATQLALDAENASYVRATERFNVIVAKCDSEYAIVVLGEQKFNEAKAIKETPAAI